MKRTSRRASSTSTSRSLSVKSIETSAKHVRDLSEYGSVKPCLVALERLDLTKFDQTSIKIHPDLNYIYSIFYSEIKMNELNRIVLKSGVNLRPCRVALSRLPY